MKHSDSQKQQANIKCVCINLRRAASTVTSSYDRYLKPTGLTTTQYSLLSNLKHLGTCTTSRWAEYVGLERTTLVRTIKPLFQKGYIEDLSSESSRNRQIRLTASGLDIIEKSKPLWQKAQHHLEDTIGIENIAILLDLLKELQ